MYRVNLVGVEIVKNKPTATGGPGGGAQPPRALQEKRRGVGGQF